MVNLARGFVDRGLEVDVVLAKAEGPYLSQLPPEIRVVDLGAARVLTSLPGLVRYLRRERPRALLSALDHANVAAAWARRLARVPLRLVVSTHTTLSIASRHAKRIRERITLFFARFAYRKADAIVAVSHGVADDLARITGMPREKIRVIYNPVVTPDLFRRAEEPLKHPWFRPGEPPVVLGVGRLTAPKDFATLIRAFALVRRHQLAHLLILGEGEERPQLEALARDLSLTDEDVALPGFVENPYNYMKRCGVVVLSSRWEGLPTVLIEAAALGVPIVSTDCPSGPAEVLRGNEGLMVPVGDKDALAQAIIRAMDSKENGAVDVTPFTLPYAVSCYAQVLDVRR